MSGGQAAEPLIPGRPRLSLALLAATAAIEGTLVMVLEIAGGRVIGPFFGVGLFVWTSLIAVTLLSLACGYALGGAFADRWRRPSGLYSVITLAGVLVLVTPVAQARLIAATMDLGLRTGALTASALILMPPLVLLGMVSPYVIRLAASGIHSVGRTAGAIFALSTVGSLAGTVATGFLLIEMMGTRGIFACVGSGLVIVGALYFVLSGRRLMAAAAASSMLLTTLYPASLASATTADGTRATLIDNRDSFHGNVRIVDYRHPSSRVQLRELLLDGLVQGGIDMADGRSVYAYSDVAAALPDLMLDERRRRDILVIGLGAGVAVRTWAKQGHAVDIVEINATVAELAASRFGPLGERTLHLADARHFLATSKDSWDVIFLDVFGGDITPGALLSREAMALISRHLRPGGLFIANLVGRLEGDTRGTASIARTAATAFADVGLYPLFEPGGDGNLLLAAHDGQAHPPSPEALRHLIESLHPMAAKEAANMRHAQPPQHPRALVLTDDYNPLEQMDIDLREAIRDGIRRTTPAAILLAQPGPAWGR